MTEYEHHPITPVNGKKNIKTALTKIFISVKAVFYSILGFHFMKTQTTFELRWNHTYISPALSNKILSIISFALFTERYPSSIFSFRTLHSEKRNARREP